MTTHVRWLVVCNISKSEEFNPASRIERQLGEIELVQGETSPYHPATVDSIALSALNAASDRIGELNAAGYAVREPQLCIRPVLGEEDRASFGLSSVTIRALAELGGSLDFDPY